MMRRARAVIAALALLLLLAPHAGHADQTDPRLDALFSQLQTASDPAAAARIDAEIWRIWGRHRDQRAFETTVVGATFLSQGQTELAALAFTEAIDRAPDFAEAWNKRATLRYLTGDLEGSVADCIQVLRLEPRHYGALSGLGLIAMRKQDWQAAIRWFEAALALNPHMTGAQENIAEARKRWKGEET